ncbi:MAG: hypothetical protein WC900_05200 [Oscillospiraceae bacterium]|jgi:hypothetical protein
MPNVEFILSGKEDARLVDQLNKMERTIQNIQGKLDHTGKTGSKAFGDIDGELKKVVGSMMGPVGLAGAVAAVVSQLKSAYDLMIQNRQLANQTQIGVAEARNTASINLPNTFQGGQAAYHSIIADVAKKTGMPLAQVYTAAGPALSAKGSASSEEFKNALNIGSNLQIGTGGAINAGNIATSLLIAQGATGSKNAMANLGWIKQAGASALINTFEGQLRMLPPVSTAMTKEIGDTGEQAMELQATVSKIIGDTKGERTATGYTNLITDLKEKELVPYYKTASSGKKEMKFKRLEGKNTYERIANLQKTYKSATEKEKIAMIKQFGGEAGMKAFIYEMFGNTEKLQSELATSKAEIGLPDATSEAQGKKFLEGLYSDTSGQVLKSDIQTKQAVEEIQLANPKRAMEQQAWEKYKTVTSALNIRPGAGFMYDINNMIGGAFNKDWNLADTLSDRVGELTSRAGVSGKDMPPLQELQKALGELSETIKKLDRNIQVKDTNNPSSQELDQ